MPSSMDSRALIAAAPQLENGTVGKSESSSGGSKGGRVATVSRKTGETDIEVTIDLDGSGNVDVSTPCYVVCSLVAKDIKILAVVMRFP